MTDAGVNAASTLYKLLWAVIDDDDKKLKDLDTVAENHERMLDDLSAQKRSLKRAVTVQRAAAESDAAMTQDLQDQIQACCIRADGVMQEWFASLAACRKQGTKCVKNVELLTLVMSKGKTVRGPLGRRAGLCRQSPGRHLHVQLPARGLKGLSTSLASLRLGTKSV